MELTLPMILELYETYGSGILPLLVLVFSLRWLQKNQTSNTASMAELASSVRQSSLVLASLERMLLTHDLTVRGLNPEAGADINERTNKAYLAYLRLMEDLDRVLDHLKG